LRNQLAIYLLLVHLILHRGRNIVFHFEISAVFQASFFFSQYLTRKWKTQFYCDLRHG